MRSLAHEYYTGIHEVADKNKPSQDDISPFLIVDPLL